ncbi:cysteine-tryptophan domain-containing zinc finger protein 3-like [Phragmites australis]|uniref:cysteine-tryptophan domain-containing zinc finger protein 3-like n=1 Tax=Phragmites australis TaxID=29695 RepID=UPI002D7890E4|nr:cysteine-tryptophan domain-containing zinc finger protein 3-like [Phragmites australis]
MVPLRGAPLRQKGGVADDVEELEEGEACPDGDDDEAFFDPDAALSYIDEKLQRVLGHFQKDFEGGVSAEILGSKFGGYGSFLPTYQRSSPPLPQTRSPHMAANISTSRSPYQPSAERMDQNASTAAVESISQNNSSGAPSTSDLCKKERCSSTNGEESVGGSDSLESSFNGSDSKSLKVGSNNALPRKNAAIYSGLGLDISSSSSLEESPDRLRGLSPELSNVPYESPWTILQVMTCFPVPGGLLLSPLCGNMLQLTNKVAPLVKKWETHLDIENAPRAFEGLLLSSLPPGHVRGHVAKHMKSGSKKKISTYTKTRKDKGDTGAIVNKEVNIEMLASQEITLDMPASTMELMGESQFAHESTRNTCISKPSQQNEDVRLKEQIRGNDLATVKAEAIKAEATKYTENSGFGNSGTGYLAPKGEPKINTDKVAIDIGERDMSNHKSSSFDRKKKSKVKTERKFEAAAVDFEYEDRNKDWGVGPCDDLRNVHVKETFSSNKTGYDNSRTEVKRMHKERQVNAAASYDFLEDDNCTHYSAAVIDRKNHTQLKSSHLEKKTRSHNDLSENLPNRSQGGMEGVLLDNRSAQGELCQKENMMNTNNENDFDVGSARKDIPTSVKHGRFPVSEEQLHMPSTSGVATTNADPFPVPVVIKDHWVCCDICQKWRLLPYGTNPSMLPKKWKCSMLYWLPGMNRCDISQDETTDALNALYVIPALATGVSSGGPHTAGAGTATSSVYNISGQIEQSRKRKIAPSDGNGLVESSYHTPLSIPLMSNQQDPSKNKRTIDGEHYNFKKHSVNKHLRPMSRSADLVSEKQKSKHNHSSYSDGGYIRERTKAHSKIRNKRGIDQDEHKTSKKTKKEDRHQIDRDRDHDCDSAGGEVADEPEALSAKAKAMKGSRETGDICLHKEKVTSGYDLLEKPKSTNDVDVPFHRGEKERPSDVGILDLSSKKKVVKEWEENQVNSIHCVSNGCKNENLKDKKSNILKSEEMASKMDSKPGKFQHADTVLSSSGGRLNHELVADDKFVTGKEGSSELWETLPPRQAMDLAEPTGRDVAYLQSSTAATSSSSKISSSQRNKNSREARDSPVESVFSSPLRSFNIVKLSQARKDGMLNVCFDNTHSPVKYPNTEVGVLGNGQQAGSQAAGEPFLHSFQGSSYNSNKELAQSACAQVSDITRLDRSLDNNLPKASCRKDLTVNDTGVGRGDRQLCSGNKKGLDTEGPSPQPGQQLSDHMYKTLDTKSDPTAHGNKNIETRQGSGSGHQMDMSFGKEKSHSKIDNQDIQKPVAQVVNLPMEESKQEICPTSVKSESSKMKVKLIRSNVQNGVQRSTVKQAIFNSLGASPMRKDGSMVTFALKEARDLKHKANHMKNNGLEVESTGLYFEAALKFLHVAFLLETPNFDSSRPGDAAQSMKMYSETAKLCNFCAHEYERCKKMAAAALAYKCEEVAYLKVASYKHPSASKDQQELQAIVQIAPDIDNINSHGLSKAPSTKDGSSPQVAGNHLPLPVRNQAHLLRLLAYINDVNSAFDATRKSQVAIASAAGNQEREKGVDDGLASVKTVLDFNFNNVNELLRLVRLSIESISM